MAQNKDIAKLVQTLEDSVEAFEITGGGKGWTLVFELNGNEFVCMATSKTQALVDALAKVQAVQAFEDEPADEQDDDEAGCSEMCQRAKTPYCTCKCGGENHPVIDGEEAVFIGTKECKCGCGETTDRLFKAGHDARYHARMALIAEAAKRGLTVSATELVLKVERNAAKAAKARAKREIAKAAAAIEPVEA
jgi:choline dehydrogenase-like flavoprotein